MQKIKIEKLNKVYRKEDKEVFALKNISLEIDGPAVVTIYGPSGSGKTTLLSLIATFDTPTAGRISVNGVEPFNLKRQEDLANWRKKTIGFIFQSFNLLPMLTAWENIILPLGISGLTQAKKDKILKIAEYLEISHRLKHFPQELSAGEKQRIAIIRALVNDPQIILADESTSDLDNRMSERVLRFFYDLNQKESKVVIIATNDKTIADKFSKRIVLEQGMLV